MALERPAKLEPGSDETSSKGIFAVIRSQWWFIAVSTLLALLTALAYSNTLNVPFIFDDIPNIKYNELIFRYREFTVEEFKRFWISRFPRGRPVSLFTFALNYCFGRFDTTGYHVVNITIHILSGVGVFCFTRFLLLHSPVLIKDHDDERDALNQSSLIAGTTALVWTLHPIQTQSVTYIVQRMTSLAGMFYFWGLYFYLRRMHAGSRFRKWGFFALVVLFFFLGIGSKEIFATFPVAIWLLLWLFFPDRESSGLRPWVHLTGVLIFVGLIGIYFLMGSGGFTDVIDKLYRTSDFPYRHWSTPERLMTEARVVVRYLWMILLPFPFMLSLERNPDVSTGLLTPPSTLLCFLLIVGLLYLAWRYHRRYPVMSFSILWFGLHLVITSTVLPLELMYDHRLYLPLFGPVFFLVYSSFVYFRVSKIKWIGIGITVSLLLGVSTYARNQDWSSWISIYEDAVQKAPEDPRAHGNLGSGYNDLGEELLKKGNPDEAYSLLLKGKKQFKRARSIARKQNRPKHLAQFEDGLSESEILLAIANLDRGRVAQALKKWTNNKPVTSEQDRAEDLGQGLIRVRAEIKRGDIFRATKRLFMFISRFTNTVEPYLLLAAAYLEKDQPMTSRKIIDRAPRTETLSQQIHRLLIMGKLLMRQGKLKASSKALEKALSRVKDVEEDVSRLAAEVHATLARYHELYSGRTNLRNKHSREALRLNPEMDHNEIRKWSTDAE